MKIKNKKHEELNDVFLTTLPFSQSPKLSSLVGLFLSPVLILKEGSRGATRKIMGNGYNHHFHNQNLHLQHKSTFLPMLCSGATIKDVTLPKLEYRSMSISSTDPLSPEIGCMGQVKINSKIVGFPTSNKLTVTPKNNNNVKYSKLKRIFSGKNLTGTTASIASSAAHRRREVMVNGAGGAKIDDTKENSVSVSIENMDPPLPVVKRVQQPTEDGEANSLWKRRSGGLALKNLQLQEIQLNRSSLAPTTV